MAVSAWEGYAPANTSNYLGGRWQAHPATSPTNPWIMTDNVSPGKGTRARSTDISGCQTGGVPLQAPVTDGSANWDPLSWSCAVGTSAQMYICNVPGYSLKIPGDGKYSFSAERQSSGPRSGYKLTCPPKVIEPLQ